MRRDGIKLLERQKSLAVEKKRLQDEREALTADRQQVEKLHLDVAEENQRLREKESQIEEARAALEKLDGERQKWERDLAVAQQATESLEQRRLQTESQLLAAEKRVAEIDAIVGQRDSLLAEIAAVRQTAADIESQLAAAQTSRQQWTQKETELAASERALADHEARHLADSVSLRESLEQLEVQRQSLADAARALSMSAASPTTQNEVRRRPRSPRCRSSPRRNKPSR